MSNISTARTEGYSAVLREAVETLRTRDHVHAMTPEGLREILGEPALYRAYKALLSEQMSADSAESFGQLCDNFQTQTLSEASLSGIQPISVLSMPVLRKAWPKIGVKEAIPTEAVKTPKFTVSTLYPYMKDPATGAKLALPQALRTPGLSSSQKAISGAKLALPMDAVDVMPAGCPVAAGYTIDPVFAIVGVDITVTDAAGANPETFVNVRVYDGQAETRAGNVRTTVTQAHSSGFETSDTLFGYVEFSTGLFTATTLSGGASATSAKITAVYLSGKIESTSNQQSTSIGYDVMGTEVHIGTGEHFDAALPLEWLQDNLALYNIDGTLKVVDILTEVLAQKVDIDGVNFLEDCYDQQAIVVGTDFTRTFNVFPTGQYNGTPTDWMGEIRRVTDNLAQTMRNQSNMGTGGVFAIVGNPIDVALYPGINWIFTAQASDQRDGVDVNYSIGAISGAQRYTMFSSQNVPAGALYMVYIPGVSDIRTVSLFLYTFNVERSSSGFVSPNTPNVPSVLMTQRRRFQNFLPLVSKINILNNNGTMPA